MTSPLGLDKATPALFIPAGVKTADYVMKPWEFAEFNASAASRNAFLPAAAKVGDMVIAKRIDLANTDPANAFTVFVKPENGTDTIRNGLATSTQLPLSGQDQTRMFIKELATQWTALVNDPLPSLYPRLIRVVGSQTTIKAGDSLNGSTVTANTEQQFATAYEFAANSLVVGNRIRIDIAGIYNISLNAQQRPRIRFGPTASALTARNAGIDFGSLNALISTVTDAGYFGYADFVVESIAGTAGVLRCVSELKFVTAASGQVTPFLAGPSSAGGTGATSGAGKPGSIAFDPTVANTLTASVGFDTATAANNNVLREFGVSVYGTPVGAS